MNPRNDKQQQQGGQQDGQQHMQDENFSPAVVSFDDAESALAMKEYRRTARHVVVD